MIRVVPFFAGAFFGAVFAASANAQQCDSIVSRTGLATLTGHRINFITIKPYPPPNLPAFGAFAARFHSTTRAAVIRRDLLFAPGETLDTLRMAASLRRLRQRSYLSDVFIEGHVCPPSNDVDLVVRTYDRWTTKPRLAVQSTSSLAGIEEDNIFGTGSAGSLSLAVRENKVGASVGYESPWALGTPLSLKLRASIYPDGEDFRLRLRSSERTIFDRWRREVILSSYSSHVKGTAFQQFRRRTALVTFGRRFSESASSIDAVLFGADYERTSLNAPDIAPVVGPRLVRRQYFGPKIGLSRRAAVFDTLTWLMQKQVIVDIPLGIEWEGIAGAGHEQVSRQPALFLSAWAGKMWVPTPEQLFQADFWTTGYRISHRGNWDAGSVRTAFHTYRKIGDGVFSTHWAAEKLVNPDPDVRALGNIDITSYLLTKRYRLAEEAYAGSVQRTVHIGNLGRGIAIDGAGFFAGSYRWSSPVSQHDHFGVLAAGTGLRLVPGTPGSGGLRLDLLYPLLRSSVVKNKPVFAISISPWLEASRQREDPRLHQ